MMALDTQILLFLNGFAGASNWLDGLIIFFASYLPWLLVATALLFVCISARKRDMWKVFFVATSAMFVGRFVVVDLTHLLYQRPRPFLATRDVHSLFQVHEWSFPSAHALVFFALATAIFLYNKKWGAGLYAGALLVVIARVAAGVHYPSDVLVGAGIGVIVACLMFYLVRR